MENEEKSARQHVYDMKWKTLLKQTKGFSGSRAILQEPNLSCQARVLFHIISSYASSGEGFCCASTKTLGKHAGLSETSVKKYINELEEIGFIVRQVKDTGFGPRRHIYISFSTLMDYYTTKNS